MRGVYRLPALEEAKHRRGLATQGSNHARVEERGGARSKSAMAGMFVYSSEAKNTWRSQLRATPEAKRSEQLRLVRTPQPAVRLDGIQSSTPDRNDFSLGDETKSEDVENAEIQQGERRLQLKPFADRERRNTRRRSQMLLPLPENFQNSNSQQEFEIQSPQTMFQEDVPKLAWPSHFQSLSLLEEATSFETDERDFLLHTIQQVPEPTPRTLRGLSSIRLKLLGRTHSASSSSRAQIAPIVSFHEVMPQPVATEIDSGRYSERRDSDRTEQLSPSRGARPRLRRSGDELLKRALTEGTDTDGSEETRLDAWFQSDRMIQRRRLINQYLECCSHVNRLPFLKNHLQFFLHKPRQTNLDMSGSAITSLDIDAFFSAMTGRGCGLNPDKTTSYRVVNEDLEDSGLRGLDVSNNTLGAEGTKILSRTMLGQDFFNMEPSSTSLPPPAPCPPFLGPAKALTELDLSQNSIGSGGARALQQLLSARRCTIEKLTVSGNQLQDWGCSVIVGTLLSENRSLRKLDISENNAAELTGVALGSVLKVNTVLAKLNASYNHIRATGAKAVCVGLMKNTALTELKLQWNGFGDEDALSTLSRALPIGGLTSLNLAHNRISLKGATILSQGIEKAGNLTALNMDGNFLGQVGSRMILRAAAQAASIGGEFVGPTSPSISTITNPIYGYRDKYSSPIHGALPSSVHGHAEVCKTAFDPCEPAGDYELDMNDPYYRSILIKLIEAQQNGRGSFQKIRVNGVATSDNATLELTSNAEKWTSVQISDDNSIDEVDWGIVVQTASGEVRLPVVEAISSDGSLVPLVQAWAEALERMQDSLSCLLRFHYSDLRKRSKTGDRLQQNLFTKLHDAFCAPDVDTDECVDLMNTVLSSDVFISVAQMEMLLNDLAEDESNSSSRKAALSKLRILFIAKCFHKVSESGRNKEFLGVLTNLERHAAETMIGQVSLDFTPNNPTGFHKLDLSEPAQRDICFRLIEMRNEMEPRLTQIKEFYSSGRVGGRREDEITSPDFERIWRNGKLDEKPFSAQAKVPDRGIVQVDFVQITKPDLKAMQAMTLKPGMTDAQFAKFLEGLNGLGADEKSRVVQVRGQSDLVLFTCRQICAILATFSEPEMRVEICVIGFARTIDWHGYKYVVAKLDTAESKILEDRIGPMNLFDDVMAVDYYELNLADRAQRFVMQELLHLAAEEPGNNMVDVTMNGVDFNVPKTWLKEVGRSGEICLYYCREQKVIEKVLEKGAWESPPGPCHLREDGTPFGSTARSTFMPNWLAKYCKEQPDKAPPATQPAGDGWVMPYKLRRIKARMAEKFSDARGIFDAMDKDGGGSLDRKEMAMGLYKLGVWLHPKELEALLQALDEDGGGTIDFVEFEAFWNAYNFD